MSYRLSETEYQNLLRKQGGEVVAPPSEKRHKFNAKKVTIDNITFASKLEGKCYTDLKWQAITGLITEPLRQVRFCLGKHYGKLRYYVADFITIDLRTGCLLIIDAKGVLTETYKQKKKVFEELYQIPITEWGMKYGKNVAKIPQISRGRKRKNRKT